MADPLPEVLTFWVRDSSDALVGLQRLRESALLDGLLEGDRATVLTIVSELASNIHKHAGRGSVRIEGGAGASGGAVRIVAHDEGRGIPDIDLAMQDNFSTAGTLGLGLPGVRRLAQEFSIESEPGKWTRVSATVRCAGARLGASSAGSDASLRIKGWEVGRCVRPLAGQHDSGDLVIARSVGDAALLVIVDGTGHGATAHRAAAAAAAIVEGGAWMGVHDLLRHVHARLVGTVGAAVGALLLDRSGRRFSYAGVGNTTASREVGEPWRGISREGMLGERMPSVVVQEGAVAEGDVFVMCSDGVGSLARSVMPARAARRDAAGLARDIVSELGRAHDDASCIVARWAP